MPPVTGGAPVLALHCGLASGAAWRGVQAVLPGRRLICPDLPGHGGADDWDRTRDFQTQGLDAVLEVLPPAPVDVIGHSFGGCLALRLLADYPARVRSLILYEPVMFAAAAPEAQAEHAVEVRPFNWFLDAGDRASAAEHFHGIWGDGRAFETLPARSRDYITARIHLIRACEPSIAGDVHGILDRLPKAPPPCLILTRSGPPAIVDAIATGLATRLGAAVEEMGQGHMTPLVDPMQLAKRAQVFWAG